jgi:lysophospholipase L1-like esterase
MRERLINSLLLIASVVFSLFLAEGILRLTLDPVNFLRPRVEPDPILNHKIQPHSGGHDAWGFRNKAIPSNTDIVAIGDSMTYGVVASANNSWPARLQELVHKRVYNLGQSGYGPAQYLYLLEHKALTLQPSVIIVGLFLGNDLTDAYNVVYRYDYWKFLRAHEFAGVKPADIPVGVDFGPGKTRGLLNRVRKLARAHMISYRLISHAFADAVRRIKTVYFSAIYYPELTILSVDNPKINTALRPVANNKAVDKDDPKTREGLRITLEALRRMDRICRNNRVKFVVALIPTKRTVLAKYILGNTKLKNYEVLVHQIRNEEDVRNIIKRELHKQHIVSVDVLADLRNGLDQGIRVYPSDEESHPVKDGYEIIAKSIATFLSSHSD